MTTAWYYSVAAVDLITIQMIATVLCWGEKRGGGRREGEGQVKGRQQQREEEETVVCVVLTAM